MKINIIAFTKKGSILQDRINISFYNNYCSEINVNMFLSKRIFEELDDVKNKKSASLDEFANTSWENSDAIIFIGATGIAIRAIAKYVTKKDKDPAVIVIDELGNFVIPLLSGHIGGANQMAKKLAEDLNSTLVLTTATDINNKLAIDSWAVSKNMEVADTKGIAPVSSAILEDKEVFLLASSEMIKELKTKYSNFTEYASDNMTFDEVLDIAKNLEGKPSVIISPYDFGHFDKVLQIVPKIYFVGMGARRDKDPTEFVEFYDKTLKELNIHKKAVNSISSIDLKADEKAFYVLYDREKENTNIKLIFKKADELNRAEEYVEHTFQVSKLVTAVAGVSNVCERAAVVSAYEYILENGIEFAKDKISFVLEKTKCNGMTISVAQIINFH